LESKGDCDRALAISRGVARSTSMSALFSKAKASAYGWLDSPRVYRLTQATVAVGVERTVTRQIRSLLRRMPPAHRVLDVGCGPKSRLWRAEMHPIGLDRSMSYLAHFRRAGEPAVAASALMLPFASSSFDAVWCFAMLHHIPDDAARASIEELVRVTRPGGYAVVLDWCWPESAWRRPGAWAVLKLDRGRYMRKREQLLSLLPRPDDWSAQRAVYSLFRCEGLFCVFRKPGEGDVGRTGPLVPALGEA